MRYMGSKGRHAKEIVPILMRDHKNSSWYVEPFVGGGNIFSEVPTDYKWGNDTAKYAVALLKALSEGWQPPTNLSEQEYYEIKEDLHGYGPELVGFAAYCCSYAGKFWGGYARGNTAKGVPRNFAAEQARGLIKQAKGLRGAKFTVGSYLSMDIPNESTIYCDPLMLIQQGIRVGLTMTYFGSGAMNWLIRVVGCLCQNIQPLAIGKLCGKRVLLIV